MRTIAAGVAAIIAIFAYFTLFAGFAFVDFAQLTLGRGHAQAPLIALMAGGLISTVAAVRFFSPSQGRWLLAGGFAGCLLGALITTSATSSFTLSLVGLLIGLSTGWTTMILVLCLRPTLHLRRLGMWCGLGVGLAYALCNQPFIFEATLEQKMMTAAILGAFGMMASFGLRGGPIRASSLPDYEFRAASGWIVALFVLVFLDTLVFFIIQNSVTLKKLSWDTPLILQGNAFVHLCAAFLTGLALDRRWSGSAALFALLLLLTSCLVLGMQLEHFPKARMLYITAVSIYSTVLIFMPARSGRPQFAALVFAISGWFASGLALSIAVAQDVRRISPYVVALAFIVGIAALAVRMLWLQRVHEVEAERLINRSQPGDEAVS